MFHQQQREDWKILNQQIGKRIRDDRRQVAVVPIKNSRSGQVLDEAIVVAGHGIDLTPARSQTNLALEVGDRLLENFWAFAQSKPEAVVGGDTILLIDVFKNPDSVSTSLHPSNSSER